MKTKRYTSRQAEALAGRLVSVVERAEIEEAPKAEKMRFVLEVRRVLLDLMKAPFGEVVIAPSVIARLHTAAGGTLYVMSRSVRTLLRENHPGGSETKSMTRGVRVFPGLRVMAVPDVRGYQFELGQGSDGLVGGVILSGLVQLQVLRLIQFIGRDRLRQCACGQVFVRRGRREYCSDRCQKRVYMRQFRGGDDGKSTRTR